jgi:xanthine dehydrogenase accessory factor
MFEEFLKKSSELVSSGGSFAVATVVRAIPPTSGKPGDKAIILPDGKLWGWIGGGCAQPVVVKEALKALHEGFPRLVRITPSPDDPEQGIVDYTMNCHSGGAMEIYIEPVLPKPHLLIFGRSPVARTLAQLARTIDYAVTVVAPEATAEGLADSQLVESQDYGLQRVKVNPSTLIVVSTQGEGDEEGLEQALKTEAAYVAFVASKTKAGKVFEFLKRKGISGEKINQVRSPAGLDIHAQTPQEIAVGILAQIIQVRGAQTTSVHPGKAVAALPVMNQPEAKDPVCGMSVNVAKARHKTEYAGKSFFFCCAGCKQSFDSEPERYLAV